MKLFDSFPLHQFSLVNEFYGENMSCMQMKRVRMILLVVSGFVCPALLTILTAKLT